MCNNQNSVPSFCHNSTFVVKCKLYLEAIIHIMLDELSQNSRLTLSTYDPIEENFNQYQPIGRRKFARNKPKSQSIPTKFQWTSKTNLDTISDNYFGSNLHHTTFPIDSNLDMVFEFISKIISRALLVTLSREIKGSSKSNEENLFHC